MTLQMDFQGEVAVVTVDIDRLDSRTISLFMEHFKQIVEKHSKIVLNVKNIEFMDSSGIATILRARQKMLAIGGDIKLAGCTDSVDSIFKLIKMERLVSIFPTVEEAVNSFAE